MREGYPVLGNRPLVPEQTIAEINKWCAEA
jgi:hypothetical protein